MIKFLCPLLFCFLLLNCDETEANTQNNVEDLVEIDETQQTAAIEQASNEFDNIGDYIQLIENEFDLTIMKELYVDINEDNLEDAIVVTYIHSADDEDEYYEATVFIQNENHSYSYKSSCVLHWLNKGVSNLKFNELVTKGNYYSFEFANAERKQITTFKYFKENNAFRLHKFGTIFYDEFGEVKNEQVLDKQDFAYVKMEDFNCLDYGEQEVVFVSNWQEFLGALGSSKLIYLEEGDYYNEDIFSMFNEELKQAFENRSGKEYFYEEEYYKLNGCCKEEIELTLQNLKNTSIIGVGKLRFLTVSNTSAVLNIENCERVLLQNIYMVHDVVGVCQGEVLAIEKSASMNFKNMTFDGSGSLSIIGIDLYNAQFDSCLFTNCSEGAIYCSASKTYFNDCLFNQNSIYSSLINAEGNSYLEFDACTIEDNIAQDEAFEQFLFLVENANVKINDNCSIQNNEVEFYFNDISQLDVDETIFK